MTTLAQQLEEALKNNLKAGDKAIVACIRQLKSKIQETTNARDFQEAIDDALYSRVIQSYVRSLEKAITELRQAGEKSRELIDSYQREISYLNQYVPQQLTEAQTKSIVEKAIVSLSIDKPQQIGQLLGYLTKEHKGNLDARLAKNIAETLLSEKKTIV